MMLRCIIGYIDAKELEVTVIDVRCIRMSEDIVWWKEEAMISVVGSYGGCMMKLEVRERMMVAKIYI